MLVYAITRYGRDVVVRRRIWFGQFHCQVFEVCDASAGETYTPIAAFYSVDEVWKCIVAEGHRVSNGRTLLCMTVEAYRHSRAILQSYV